MPVRAAAGLLGRARLARCPLVGATIGGVPYIAVAFFQGWQVGVAAIVFLIVYQQIENNVFQPVIHRYTVQLNPLWIILAVLVGANVLGHLRGADGHPGRRHRPGADPGVVEHRGRRAGRRPSGRRLEPADRGAPGPAPSSIEGVDPRSAELLELPVVRERLAGLTSFAGGRAPRPRAGALAPTRPRSPGGVARTEEASLLRDRGRRRPRRRVSTSATAVGPGRARRDARGRDARRGARHRARSGVETAEAIAPLDEVAPAAGRRSSSAAAAAPARRVEAALERALDPHGGLLDTASPELASVAPPPRRRPPRRGRPAARPRGAPAPAPAGVVHHRARRPAGARRQGVVALGRPGHRPRQLRLGRDDLRRADRAGRGQQPHARAGRRGGRGGGAHPARAVAAGGGGARGRSTRSRRPLGRPRPGAGPRRPVARPGTAAAVEPADEVDLRAARHPLLDPATAVPIDLPLAGTRALVVSGPNTGGKTVALKTLGLLRDAAPVRPARAGRRARACRCSTGCSPTSATTSRSPRACPPSRPTCAGSIAIDGGGRAALAGAARRAGRRHRSRRGLAPRAGGDRAAGATRARWCWPPPTTPR